MLIPEASPPPSSPPPKDPSISTQDAATKSDIEMDFPLTPVDDSSKTLDPESDMSYSRYPTDQYAGNDYTQDSNQGASLNTGMSGGSWRNAPGDGNRGIIASSRLIPVGEIVPGALWPSDKQMSVAKGYAIRHEDGSFARLYQVDELAKLYGIDLSSIPIYHRPEGLISLPPLKAEGQRQDFFTQQFVDSLPANRCVRPNVLAHSAGGPNNMNQVQHQIDRIVAHTPRDAPDGTPPRRKVYCDKWIHDGNCAFVQQGCRYLHVMPMDRATQQSLGLMQGLPAWWKRAHSATILPADPALITPPEEGEEPSTYQTPARQPHVTGSWRSSQTGRNASYSRPGGLTSPAPAGYGGGYRSYGGCSQPAPSSAGYGGRSHGNSRYGPIAPPPPPPPPYNQLGTCANRSTVILEEDAMKMEDGSDEGEIFFTGRRR